jgi:hypothetical protein
MFLVSHSLTVRVREIRLWLHSQPSIALIVAATYFEWTVSRAVIGLSRRSNLELRHDLGRVFGVDRYKEFWWAELKHLTDARRLPEVVKDWKATINAFEARNRLVHGRDRYTRNMAAPKVEALLEAVSDVHAYSLAARR